MKKIIFISLVFLFSCTKENSPLPTPIEESKTAANTTNINGSWYDYTRINGGGYLVPVKFMFVNDRYYYSEYNNTLGWSEYITDSRYFNVNGNLTFTDNPTHFDFFGKILTDSTISITQYSGSDTLQSYVITKD
jgi:hypothetical protein